MPFIMTLIFCPISSTSLSLSLSLSFTHTLSFPLHPLHFSSYSTNSSCLCRAVLRAPILYSRPANIFPLCLTVRLFSSSSSLRHSLVCLSTSFYFSIVSLSLDNDDDHEPGKRSYAQAYGIHVEYYRSTTTSSTWYPRFIVGSQTNEKPRRRASQHVGGSSLGSRSSNTLIEGSSTPNKVAIER